MKHVLSAILLALPLGISGVQATGVTLDTEAECKVISATGTSDCTCLGRYLESKLGPDEGIAALHLLARSYLPEAQGTPISMYERFGAAKLDKAAQNIRKTRDEMGLLCPFDPSFAD